MTKDELYNQLLDKVQNKGGFVRIKPMKLLLKSEKANRHVIVAAIFETTDNSSPLRLVTNRFTAWNVYKYLNAEDIEHILSHL